MATATLIIATYNRAQLLDECLNHVRRLEFEAGDDVIVIDNGSMDRTADVLRRHAAALPVPLRLLHEPMPGKSHALAAGLRCASGDLCIFTDDDVNVTPRWLRALRETLKDPDVAAVGGRVAPRW